MSRDAFPGSPTLPASQHGYSYAHNNSPNYTDPSGNRIFAGIDTAVCLGAGMGFVGSYSSQVASNMHNGMSFFDAVYYKNINWNQVGAATVAGGIAGATGFMAGGAVNGLVGGMLTPATTTAGAIANGILVGAASGFVDGAVSGGAYQLAYNALTPCTDWDENVLRAIGGGAMSGGIIGGAVGGIAGGWQFRRGTNALQEMAVDDVIHTADDAAADLPDEMNPPRCSFEAETPVLTDDGLVPISEIEEHQYAWAYNEETGEFGFYPIVAVWAHEDPVVLYLTIDGETLATTPNPPFYTTDGQWVQAGNLQIGDEIRDGAWQTGTVESLVFTPGPQTMYNFTVATAHTYVVGEGQWVVHNECFNRRWVNGLNREQDEAIGEVVDYIRQSSAGRNVSRPSWVTKDTHFGRASDLVTKNSALNLPEGVEFRLYDVSGGPSSVPGGRGPRRLAVGNDGSIYYTNTHYKNWCLYQQP